MERYRYDAGACSERSRRGAATVLDADGSADSDGISDVENPYAFTARRLDLESDLMYYRKRQYSVVLGRFISWDPLRGFVTFGLSASGAPYEYAEGSTGVFVDPEGRRRRKPKPKPPRPPGDGPPKPPPLHCSVIRQHVRRIELYLSMGSEEAAATEAKKLYEKLAWGGGFKGMPLAAEMIGRWLEGEGGTETLSEKRVKRAVLDERVKARWAVDVCSACGPNSESSEPLRIGPTSCRPGDPNLYYALGTYTLEFDGQCCRAKNKVKLKGKWSLSDEYDWHEGLDVRICGVTIKDDYALLVEKWHGAAPFHIRGSWAGKLTITCNGPKPPGEGDDRW